MVGYASLPGVGEHRPFEQLGLLFRPIFLDVSFAALCLQTDFHVKLIGFFIGDDV